MRTFILSLILLAPLAVSAQSISSELHLNQQNDYKTRRPKKIVALFISSPQKRQSETSVKKFDNAGMLLTEERYDNSRSRIALLQYVNDTTRRLILSMHMEQWVAGLHLDQTTYYKYDANNFLTGIEEKKNGVTVSTTIIKNDEKGNPVELTATNGNGAKEYAKYLYNSNQAVISVVNNTGETLSTDTAIINYRDEYKFPKDSKLYNDKGDIIQYRSRKLNGGYDYYECEYVYDKYGNCTEEYTFIVTVNTANRVYKDQVRAYLKHYSY